MPVEVTRLERGIYRYRWLGRVTVPETEEALNKAVALGQEHGDNPHVQILDMSEVERIPMDLWGLGKIGEKQKQDVMRVMVVKAPVAGRLFGETLQKVMPVLRMLEFHNTLDEAVKSARLVVANKE